MFMTSHLDTVQLVLSLDLCHTPLCSTSQCLTHSTTVSVNVQFLGEGWSTYKELELQQGCGSTSIFISHFIFMKYSYISLTAHTLIKQISSKVLQMCEGSRFVKGFYLEPSLRKEPLKFPGGTNQQTHQTIRSELFTVIVYSFLFLSHTHTQSHCHRRTRTP